jgi:hypothetical protein
MKTRAKLKRVSKPLPAKRHTRLKRLKALANRLHGSMPNFMTQGDLKIMREDAKSLSVVDIHRRNQEKKMT